MVLKKKSPLGSRKMWKFQFQVFDVKKKSVTIIKVYENNKKRRSSVYNELEFFLIL